MNGLQQLEDIGVSLSAQQRQLAAAYAEAGNRLAAGNVVLDEARAQTQRFGGQTDEAAAASRRLAAAWSESATAIGDVIRDLGRLIDVELITPLKTGLYNALAGALDSINATVAPTIANVERRIADQEQRLRVLRATSALREAEGTLEGGSGLDEDIRQLEQAIARDRERLAGLRTAAPDVPQAAAGPEHQAGIDAYLHRPRETTGRETAGHDAAGRDAMERVPIALQDLSDRAAEATMQGLEREIYTATAHVLKIAMEDFHKGLRETAQLTLEEHNSIVTSVTMRYQRQLANSILEQYNPQRVFERTAGDLDNLRAAGLIDQTTYQRAFDDAQLKSLENSRDFFDGLTRGWMKYRRDVEDAAKAGEAVFTRATSAMEDTFVQFVTTGKISFGDLTNSILADLARMAFQQNITAPHGNLLFGSEGWLTGLFGGGSQPALSGPASVTTGLGGIFHEGGEVGRAPVPTRALPAWLFAGAPRFYNGAYLAPDEVPAILQTGERVLSRAEVAAAGRAAGAAPSAVTVQIIDQRGAGAPVEVAQSRGPDGRTLLRMTLRAELSRMVADGALDRAMADSYGLTRQGVRR